MTTHNEINTRGVLQFGASLLQFSIKELNQFDWCLDCVSTQLFGGWVSGKLADVNISRKSKRPVGLDMNLSQPTKYHDRSQI